MNLVSSPAAVAAAPPGQKFSNPTPATKLKWAPFRGPLNFGGLGLAPKPGRCDG